MVNIMAYENLLTIAKDLPEETINEVISYIEFLKFKSNKATSTNSNSSVRKHPQRVFGLLKGKIKMAEDFDAIPEDFEGYV